MAILLATSILIPLQVLGLGIIISYAMAFLIKIMLVVIKHFSGNAKS